MLADGCNEEQCWLDKQDECIVAAAANLLRTILFVLANLLLLASSRQTQHSTVSPLVQQIAVLCDTQHSKVSPLASTGNTIQISVRGVESVSYTHLTLPTKRIV